MVLSFGFGSGHKIMKLLDWCKLSIVEDMGS